MALITQAQIERHLQIDFGTDPDPVVAEYIDQAQGVADAWCQQPLEQHTVTDEFWTAVQYNQIHRLRNFPIVSVTSVEMDGVALTEDVEFIWEQDGRILRTSNGTLPLSWSTYLRGNKATYVAGWGTTLTTPSDLALGIVLIAADLFRNGAEFAAHGTDGPVKSVTLAGSDSISYATGVAERAATDIFVSERAKQLLAPYRRRVM